MAGNVCMMDQKAEKTFVPNNLMIRLKRIKVAMSHSTWTSETISDGAECNV